MAQSGFTYASELLFMSDSAKKVGKVGKVGLFTRAKAVWQSPRRKRVTLLGQRVSDFFPWRPLGLLVALFAYVALAELAFIQLDLVFLVLGYGALGVLGPIRMPYARTVSAVRFVSRLLSSLIYDTYGDELPIAPASDHTNREAFK